MHPSVSVKRTLVHTSHSKIHQFNFSPGLHRQSACDGIDYSYCNYSSSFIRLSKQEEFIEMSKAGIRQGK